MRWRHPHTALLSGWRRGVPELSALRVGLDEALIVRLIDWPDIDGRPATEVIAEELARVGLANRALVIQTSHALEFVTVK